MRSNPKKQEILLDEEIDEQEFVSIINSFYIYDCYIYAIIPEYEQDLLNELSNIFIEVDKFPLTRSFPREIGYLGYVKDSQKRYVYEFYLRSTTMDYLIFSETDVSELLGKITKKNRKDLYKLFELNMVPHITIGPDGQWLNIVEYCIVSSFTNGCVSLIRHCCFGSLFCWLEKKNKDLVF
ncbi:hypothetical protein QUF86_28370 [Peribacillus sp. NJ11]|uniref:hypothetical protein n=1 Tax=Peribacillus sp. NJ11 TaxID=3055861 RepID=UPI0025A284D2|nr:hypothetical protein [Peribacillus sp. NJ11]MDM5224555.1 hypothetical protein [Peribacillus sp. NJ11]